MARRLGIACALAALAALAAGCGGGDDPRPQAAPTPQRPGAGGDALVGGPGDEAATTPRAQAIREAKQTALLLVDVANRRDPSACELATQRYLESLTGARGAAAQTRCRRLVRRPAGQLEVIDFGGSRHSGDAVVVTMIVRAGDQRRRYRLRLVRGERGRGWLLDARTP